MPGTQLSGYFEAFAPGCRESIDDLRKNNWLNKNKYGSQISREHKWAIMCVSNSAHIIHGDDRICSRQYDATVVLRFSYLQNRSFFTVRKRIATLNFRHYVI